MKAGTQVIILILIHFIVGIITIFHFDGTGDSGDSIYHYLYAKYAFQQPELFFDHWAKPFYVLIFSPFAQLGFIAVKILNLIIVSFTLFFTYKLFNLEFKKFQALPILILIFAPLYFVLTFSGLTEPLFALMLILTFYFYRLDKTTLAFLILSMLPFVRSEGLLFLAFFGLYEVVFKNWKNIGYLFAGTILYSIVGYFVHHDIAWVFTKIPYASTGSVYGSGDFFHFFEQLLYVVGIPIYIFIWLGVIFMIVDLIKKRINFEQFYLLVLGAGMFIVAHSLFWYLGIFNSMGLKRVLIGILPLLAIIGGFGLMKLTILLKSFNLNFGRIFLTISIFAIVLFPFSGNKAALDFEDLKMSKDQELALEVKQFLDENNIQFNKLYAAHPNLCKVLDVNCFSNEEFEFLGPNSALYLKENDILIWESWFSIVEQGVDLNHFMENESLKVIFEVEAINRKGREVKYVVFVKNHSTSLPK